MRRNDERHFHERETGITADFIHVIAYGVIHAKCSLRGRNKQKNITTAKSTGKTMTSGVITTRNMMKHPAM